MQGERFPRRALGLCALGLGLPATGSAMRVTGPDGLDEVFGAERDAVLRALHWAGAPIDDDLAAPIDALYDLLERTLQRTGDVIWVREA